MNIQDKLKAFLELNKEIHDFRQKQKEQKKTLETLEKEIHQYMTDNNMDSISLNDGEIILYDKKTSLTYKKETMLEKLTEELKDEKQAEKLVDTIISNKVFTSQKKLKATLKKR